MSCDYPRTVYRAEGGILFEKPSGGSDGKFAIPCRQCTGCRMEHKRMWSIRMMHEAQMHEQSQFVTLTYNDESIPINGDLCEYDMQTFWKRLRDKHEAKIRYVYSAEYGGEYSRPHYHAIIFGLDVPDLEKQGQNKRGESLYKSTWLDEIWGNGYTTTGTVTQQSCAYVAGYMLKDSLGNYHKTEKHVDQETGKVSRRLIPYISINTKTGECQERARPFARFSTKPGIGATWYEKYKGDVFPHDHLVIQDGKKSSVPDYYFRKLEKENPELHAALKSKREASIWTDAGIRENTNQRRAVRAICRDDRIKKSARGSCHQEENLTFLHSNSAIE